MLKIKNGKKFFVISDDLTGSNGISGMMAKYCDTITFNVEKIFSRDVIDADFECATINIQTRMVNEMKSYNISLKIKNFFEKHNIKFGKRIDSTLRGNIEKEILPFSKENVLIFTDTIPEYGRYTENGFTIMGDKKLSIVEKFQEIKALPIDLKNLRNIDPEEDKGTVFIVDSKTHEDLRIISKIVLEKGFVPVDPIPMVSNVGRLFLKKKDEKKCNFMNIKKISYIIGSNELNTKKQVDWACNRGFELGDLNNFLSLKNDNIIKFDLFKDINLLNKNLITFLKGFDAIVLSGGETANFIFKMAKGSYIKTICDIQPLIGVGKIIGGDLNGKIIITKGGSIGSDDVYIRIRDFLKGEKYEK